MISENYTELINHVLESYINNTNEHTSYIDHSCQHNDKKTSADDIFNPNVFIWDPLKPNVELICPHCYEDSTQHNLLQCTDHWTRNQTNSLKPRIIWDTGWFCILVGRIYKCKNHHRVISYHAGVLRQLETYQISFVLTHDSGFTNRLFDFIVRLVENGTSFAAIQRVLRENFLDEYMRREIRVNRNFPLLQNTFKTTSPGVKTIIDLFQFNHYKYEELYQKHFSSIRFKSLCMDHTFKVAANIGYMQDKKWIKVFDSLFIVLTEDGLIKSFKFTKGTSFDNIDDLLTKLAQENTDVEYILVDNCCHVSNLLLNKFPGSKIKLDLFHAVKRLTQFIPKKHPFHAEAAKSVGLIFRKPEDFGGKRSMPTADSNLMLEQLKEFLSKWKNVNYQGWKVINRKCEEEFQKLTKHIVNDCLSNIPVSLGTSQNESLHKFLKQFGRARLSVSSAVATMTHLFYAINTRKSGASVIPPIWSQFKSDSCSLEQKRRFDCGTEASTNDFFELDFELLTSMTHPTGPVSDALKILNLASALYSLHLSVPKKLREKLYRFQGFTTLPTECWSSEEYFTLLGKSKPFPSEMLNSIIGEMGLTVHTSNGDFYSAFLFILKNLVECTEIPYHLRVLIESVTTDANPLCQLKILIHNEISHQQTSLFSLPMAATNAFDISVVVVPTVYGLPMYPFLPNVWATNTPVFVLFNPLVGEFHALLKENKVEAPTICYCGQKGSSSSKKVNCSQNFRCSCLKSNVSCSSHCKCKCCGNNKEIGVAKKRRRCRIPHNTLDNISNLDSQFLLMAKETINPAITTIQHFVFEAGLHILTESLSCVTLLNGDVREISEEMLQQQLNLKEELKEMPDLFSEIHPSALQTNKDIISQWINYRKKKSILMKKINE